MKIADQIYIRGAIDSLAKKVDKIENLQHKLDPWNNGADTHISVAEKHEIYELLGELIIDIEIADRHAPRTQDIKYRKRYFRRK